MISRRIVLMFAGLTLAASPVLAKDKAPPVPAKVALPTIVDPNPANSPENVVVLDLSNGGRVMIRLMPEWAPGHTERIKSLVAERFYDGIIFHRVIDGFMAQTGDPTGTGTGGSKLPDLKAEFNSMPHVRGSVSMAHAADPDSGNSQFFVVFYPRFSLDRKYTVFGRVISGMDAIDRIERGEPPENPTKIVRASLASQGLPPPVLAAPAADKPISIGQLNSSTSN